MRFVISAVSAASGVCRCLPACLLALAGCAPYTPKPIDPLAQAAAFEARTLAAPDVRQAAEEVLGTRLPAWPPQTWDFPTLAAAALHFQPDVQVAAARRRVAEGGTAAAAARPNPGGTAVVQRSQDPAPGTSPWTYDLGLAIPVETAGKRDDRIERARLLAQAAALREAEARWRARSRVREAFLSAYPADAAMTRQQVIQEEIVGLLEHRLAAGYASRPEITQAHLALQQTTLAVEEARKRRAEAMAQLAAAVGLPARALDGVTLSFGDFERPTPVAAVPVDEARRRALLDRPDVLAALADYGAAQAALQQEIARQYPDLSIGPGYSWDAGTVKWSLGLSLVLPLLDRNEGPIAEAEARREEAAATFRAVQAKAIGEVDEALTSHRHATRLLGLAERLLRERQSREKTVEAAFRAGESDRLDWLSARYETAVAESARVRAQMEAEQARGRLEDALRRPLPGKNDSAGRERS